MQVEIVEKLDGETGKTVRARCGKVEAVVGIYAYRSGYKNVAVLCLNAAHRAWRGGGRNFRDIEAALLGYKSAEMKAIINAAAAA